MRYRGNTLIRRLRIHARLAAGRISDNRLRKRQLSSSFGDSEYRVYSQHREDGVLDWLLRHGEMTNGSFIEFGFAPHQCNCLNLAVNRGYSGLFIDGNATKCDDAREILGNWCGDRVRVVNHFLDSDSINKVTTGMEQQVTVLSIDVDGNDYWLWEAMDVEGQVVVIEYNASFGPTRSITVPYDPRFDRYSAHPSGFYHGASLEALTRLARRRGYYLVGADRTGVNAFYVKRDTGIDVPEVSVESAWREHRGRTVYKKRSTEAQFAEIENMPYETIN